MKTRTHSAGLKVGRVAPRPPHTHHDVFGAGDQNSALAGREPYHAVATAKTGRDGVPPPPTAGGDNGGKDERSAHSERIVALMRKNPKISVSAIVSAIGGGKRSVEREIAALKKAGRITRRGTYAGEWIVLDA